MVEIKEGAKPVQGGLSSALIGPGTYVRQTDETGRITSARPSGAPLDTANVVSPQEFNKQTRIGDYYYDRSGNLSVVPNSPTDIFNKWKITSDTSLYAKPTREGMNLEGLAQPVISTGAVGGVLGAVKGAGALAGAAGGLLTGLAIGGVVSANAQMAQEKAYRDALKDWQKSQEKAVWDVAGNLTTDENGRIFFTPDPSKAITMNTAFAGSEIQKAFSTDTSVALGDDGRLKINVNPVFAATDQYKEMVDLIKKGYAGLTKDSDNVDTYIEEIRSYVDNANNQFKFREQSMYSYKAQIPDASDVTIEDAYTNEVGAYMSEKDGGDYEVKVYRDGKIVTETAQKVLENVYDKNLGERSDYMLSLFSKMDDPNISANDKVYILSEIKMLNAADENDQKYDNGQKDENGATVKTTNKYYGMLDQESIISALNNWSLLGGVTVVDAINALDAITPWNMHISDQRGLQEDPAAASAARLISTATSALTSYLAMQGIEHGIIRPIAGKIGEAVTSGMGSFLERLAARGGKLSEIVGEMQLASGAIGSGAEVGGNAFAQWLQGARLAAGPLMKTLGFTMSELLYNATSDLLFDAAKQGARALAGDEPTSEEFLEEFGTDLVMDLVIQYGPAGLAQARTAIDNYRVEAAYAPYREGVEFAQQQFDAAELDYQALKNEVEDMRKGTKKYKEKSAELKTKQQEYETAKANYEKLRTEAETAVKEVMPSMSEELGAMLAGKIAKAEESNILMWLRKKFTDEKAGLSTLAEQAYNKTKDVYMYAAAINKFQSIQAGIREVGVKMKMDYYAKGTGKAYQDFANAYATVAPSSKLSKTQTEYLIAKAEYDAWSKAARDDDDLLAKVEEKYLPYINKVQGEDATRLNQVLETMKAWLRKVGESYVKSDAATKQQVKDIENAALGIEYVPLWGKDAQTKKFGIFEVPLTMRVGRAFDESKGLFDVEGVRNPVESAISYVSAVQNNIARNEMAAMLKDIATIDGVGVELVGSGAAGAAPEFQDIIDEAIQRVAKSKEQMLKTEITQDKYASGLEKLLSGGDNNAAIKGLDNLVKEQQQLQRLIELNNAETDAGKRAGRLTRISNLDAKIKEQKAQVRADIDNRVRLAGEYFNKTYKKYGITVDVDDYLSSAKYTKMIDGKLNSLSTENLIRLKDDIARTINEIAPYLSLKKVDTKVVNKQVAAVKTHTRNRVEKEHPEYSTKRKHAIVNQTAKNFRAQLSGDYGMMYDDGEDITTAGAYKIPFTSNNQDASFYIKGKLAKEVAAEMTTKNIADRRAISEFFKEAANIKRLLTTGIDPTRVLPNLVRDTIRNGIMSGGTDYWFFDNSPFGFTQMFTKMAKAMGDTDEQIANALNTLKASQEVVSGSTYNEALHGRRTNVGKRLVESSNAVGDNRGVKFVWELAHDKKALLEAPMNWAEGLTRDRAAASAFMRAYMRGGEGLSYETRLSNAYEAGLNAGRENTVNFLRRGTFINEIASYVPYLSQRFASIESTKIAFLKDPIGVSSRLMIFGMAYMIELSRTLADERSRKNYYNLSEYDRENNIILSLGNGNLVTIPLDETIAAIIYPWRRGLETMHNVDPEAFYMTMVNGFLELSPFDLSGFTEGDSFNFGRGLEKLGAQVLPTLGQFAYTQLTGRNMYYGSTVEVTADDLAEYGNYNPTAGDFTTIGKNSQVLRAIADALGIEQWRLQQGIADLGGNVGQYVVNWLDKVTGAPEDAQGGKEFMDATFKSFTGMDSTQVQHAFNDGINQLTEEKGKLRSKLVSLNQQISLASGTRLAELQEEYRKVKQDFAMKVGNFVDKYINAYEIAGGLSKAQANKIWYLLNFADDDSLAMSGSVESYYRDLAKKQANNEATKYSANILDKYYDQTKNVYKDSSGKWHYYSPYGEQSFFNTVQGRGMEYQIGLRNLVESDLSDLSAERSKAYDDREAAYQAGNWDEYDKIGLRFDDKVIETIAPYVKRYGASNVLTNSSVLDYLEEWFFVPSSYMKSKYGKNVSLAHNASKQRAFVRPYIKELFGLGTRTESNYISRPENLVRGGE